MRADFRREVVARYTAGRDFCRGVSLGGGPATVGVFRWRCLVPQGGSVTQQKPIHYRLVGAVILVLAAVLFLPWLLDGAGYESVQGLDQPVPERPVFTEPFLPEVSGANARWRSGASGLAPATGFAGETADAQTSRETPPAPVSASASVDTPLRPPASSAGPAELAPSLRADGAEDGVGTSTIGSAERRASTSAPSASRVPAPSRVEAPQVSSSNGSGWAVQVGSYAREPNAREQMAQLRDLDFPAFVERVRVEGRETWRVKVGPTPQREQALRLREEVRARAGVNGIVLAHP